jgi:uncharacterized protein YbjT (DUF2867 family)
MILITGASGAAGRAVLEEVRKSAKPVKAMYRSAEDAPSAPPGVAAVLADFADSASLAKAFAGVEAIYLVCSPVPQLVELENNAIAAAKKAGVRHVVLNSALGAEDYPKSFPSWHRKVEDNLKSSGMAYTILRPNSFHQNVVAYQSPSIRASGAFYAAMGDARISYIDLRDIAAVAAKTLLFPAEHAGKTYELNGPEAVSYAEVAAKISRASGRTVTFVNIPEEAQRQGMLDLGMPGWQVEALLDLQRYYTVERKGAVVDGLLEKLLGRAPIPLDRFLTESKDSFRGEAATA